MLERRVLFVWRIPSIARITRKRRSRRDQRQATDTGHRGRRLVCYILSDHHPMCTARSLISFKIITGTLTDVRDVVRSKIYRSRPFFRTSSYLKSRLYKSIKHEMFREDRLRSKIQNKSIIRSMESLIKSQ